MNHVDLRSERRARARAPRREHRYNDSGDGDNDVVPAESGGVRDGDARSAGRRNGRPTYRARAIATVSHWPPPPPFARCHVAQFFRVVRSLAAAALAFSVSTIFDLFFLFFIY